MARGEAEPFWSTRPRVRVITAVLSALGLLSLLAGLVLAAAGDLDPRFGNTGLGPGKAFAELRGYDEASAVAIQSDGYIVVAGTAAPGGGQPGVFALARFVPDGTLDPSFGSGGKVTTPIGERAQLRAMKIQPDGKIVVAGYTETGFQENFAVLRYRRDGSLDPEFGGGGAVLTDFGTPLDKANALAIQPDGKIVAAGTAGGRFALARYEPDGTLDVSFGYGGQLRLDDFAAPEGYGSGSPSGPASWTGARAVAIEPDGKIVMVGAVPTDPYRLNFGVIRVTPGGALDPSFGEAGKVITSFDGERGDGAYAVAIQPDWRIVVGGIMGGTAEAPHDNLYALARYNVDGSLDTSFASNGMVSASVAPPGGGGDDLYALALHTNGKIVAAGMSFTPTGATQFGVARFNLNGSLDTTFSGDGKLTTNFGGTEEARSVAIQPDGNIVVAGPAELNSGSRFFVLSRYLAQ
jgi:uncharacterized delta-60 repeat protein